MIYQHRDRGFSLIEILVAFSIAAISLTIIYQIYTKGTASAILGKDYSRAVIIAESRLDELGTTLDLKTNQFNGTAEDKFYWTVTVDNYSPAETGDFVENLQLKSVRVDVSWETAGKIRTVTLRSLKPSITL